jgi:hypothetical protein
MAHNVGQSDGFCRKKITMSLFYEKCKHLVECKLSITLPT